MKKYLAIAGLLSLIAGCTPEPKGFTISVQLEGIVADGTPVYLRKATENMKPVDVDTATVQSGMFSFRGKQDTPEVYYIFIDHIRGSIPVVVENKNLEVLAHKDSLFYADVKGSKQNDAYGDFMEASAALSRKAQSMNKDLNDARINKDTAVMTSLQEEFFELQEEAKEMEVNFAKEHPDALISALILTKAVYRKTLPDPEIKEIFDGLNPEVQESNVGKALKNKLEENAKTAIGAPAPNFSAPTPEGSQLALNDVLGKVTILDFWAAWCKPCRAENPNVVKLYDRYKDKGLSILGVSLDRKAADWKKAIEDDGLEWHHVSNVRYFDEIAALYNVSAIPATFILDENGIIIAKNLRGPALEAKISELLQ